MKIWIVYYYPQQSYDFWEQDQAGIKIVGIFQTEEKAYEYLGKLTSIQEKLSEDEQEEEGLNNIYEIEAYDLDYQSYSDEELKQLKSKKKR